jgi:hypothetical protein
MRVMVLAKSTPETENAPASQEGWEAMARYHEELTKAGVLLAGDRLQPSSKGARVRFDGSRRSVVDGPFTEAKELVAGFWLWQVRSLDEAIEWLKRAPFDGGEFEIREVFDADVFEEFGATATAGRS